MTHLRSVVPVTRAKQFALISFVLFAFLAAFSVLAAPKQDAAAVIYIMGAVVLPVPIAYFLVYLDGLDRLRSIGRRNRPSENGEDGDDHDPGEADVEPVK